MKPLRIPGGNLDSIGLRRPAESSAPVVVQEVAKPEPVPPRPVPEPIVVPIDGGIADAINQLRDAIAVATANAGRRPKGVDMELERDARGSIARVRATYIWG